ncbi:MAG TPA: tetratricopeptide repeat protein, partial [Kiritimatiellia bacterium]|nr:tetratricopeptide repeat protein [Kiritimatiellia bacterium]
DNISDQPAGAMRQAHLATIENRADDAEAWIQKAVDWDPSSALPYHQLGRIQFANHKHAAALSNLYAAAMMEVANAEFSYSLALAFAETGNNKLALQWLEETVRRDERFGRAWYNLGLAHAENGNLPTAIEALKKAQSLMPQNGDAAYARATLHAREGRPAEAYAAAREALEADSGHQAAQSMLRSLRINTP